MIKSILAMLAFAVVASVSAQAITLEEIIANNIEARGGYDKLKALKSLKVTGTMQTMGGEMEFTTYFKDNSKMRLNMSIQGQEIVQAFDGFVAWSVNPFMGGDKATKLPKDQNDRFAAQSDIVGEFVDWEDKGLKLEFEGAVDIDGMTAYKVNITNPKGEVYSNYVDAITWFVIKSERPTEMQGQQTTMEIVWSNFKDVGGVQMPMQMNVSAEGTEFMSMTWETAEVNITMDDSMFAFPG